MHYDFITIIKLSLATLFPVVLSIIVYLLEKKTKFIKLKYSTRQIIIGLLFGGVAILGTAYGIDIDGAVLNVRNAAPLSAGLLFGAPAGLIAGVIGGVYRFVATYFGAGEFSQIACTVGCIMAGLFGAGCRKFMFDDKKPSWIYGFIIGGTTEVLHMLLVFIFRMEDVYGAYKIVEICTIPMILCNAISVMLSLLSVSLIGKKKVKKSKENIELAKKIFKNKQITQVFQMFLMICIIVAFITTFVFTKILQTKIAYANADNLLELNLDDVKKDIKSSSDNTLLEITKNISAKIDINTSSSKLLSLLDEYMVSEINIVSSSGIIKTSTNDSFVGFDMNSGDQSREFMVLLGDTKEFVQAYRTISIDDALSRKYAGIKIDGGFIQVGYDGIKFQETIAEEIKKAVTNRHIGKEGGIIVCNEQGKIIFDNGGHTGESIYTLDDLSKVKASPMVRFTATIGQTPSYCMFVMEEGFYLIANIPEDEVMFSRDISVTILAFMEVIVFAALFVHVYFLVKKQIVDNIHKINNSLSQITGGNLNVEINVRENEEFASLSDDINATVNTLKRYISEAEKRIDVELEFARQIQHSALPTIFPPFPDRHDFDVFATMDAAKEVGGDFYDFWITDNSNLAFLVADVSGKGIPGALFMMRAKTLIKNLAETGLAIDEVFTKANQELCENNDAEMFVTAWFGVIDSKTKVLQYVNAGHNPPLIRHNNGDFEYLRTRPNFVLAGLEETKYKKHELKLSPGDEIFVYTDGVTEATNNENLQYGEERLKEILSKTHGTPKVLCDTVLKDVGEFVNDATQSDDITMLCVTLTQEIKTFNIDVIPTKESIPNVNLALNEKLKSWMVPLQLLNKIEITIDEIYSNIVYYSKATKASISLILQDDLIILEFSDDGIPYDPTKTKDPDITKPLEERSIGGLGIYMVKQIALELKYKQENNKNILTIKFKK